MIGQLRAELLKQRSTQTTLLLLVAMVGLVVLAVAMHVLVPAAATLSTRAEQLNVFAVGTSIGMLFASLVGAIAITAELRYGTIRPTFLATPRRGPVVAAKLMVSALAGIVFGFFGEGLMAGAVTAAFSARGIVNQLGTGDYLQLLAGGMVAAALWAMIGVGVGALVRSQEAALIGLCAWMLMVENLLIGFVPRTGRFMPGAAGLAIAGQTGRQLLAPAVGALLLVLYALAISAAGWVMTLRRDIA
ncbi:MAG: ABC transporter permease [Actinobacteria bacterium]|nr:ABC transporter permease [Actinomycetota bacterium]